MDAATIVALVVALGGGAGAASFITAFVTRRKILAEAGKTDIDGAQILAEASASLLEPMKSELARMSQQLGRAQLKADDLDQQLVRANRKVRELTDTIAEANRELAYYRNTYGPAPSPLPR